MKTTTLLSSFIIGLMFFACKNAQTENPMAVVDPLTGDKKVANDGLSVEVSTDTLYKLLDQAIQLDTFEFSNCAPFLFLKTGNFLSQTEKSAILVSCATDSTYRVEHYSQLSNSWIKNDDIELPDAFSAQFSLDFEDYNFDGQTDFYVQISVSNGYALSLGHLLTINPETKKIQIHPETRELANMGVDSKSKTIISEEVVWNVDYGFQGVCDLRSKWISGRLKVVKRECPSKKLKGN
jgi:hypothetical protein